MKEFEEDMMRKYEEQETQELINKIDMEMGNVCAAGYPYGSGQCEGCMYDACMEWEEYNL